MNRRRPHRAAGFAGEAAAAAGGMAGQRVADSGGAGSDGVAAAAAAAAAAASSRRPVCRLIVGPPLEVLQAGDDVLGEAAGGGGERPWHSSSSTRLIFRRLTGTEEISRLHGWEVDVVSSDPALEPKQWLGRHGTVALRLDDDEAGAAGGWAKAAVSGAGSRSPNPHECDDGEPQADTGQRHLDGLITRIGMREGPVELSLPSATAPSAVSPFATPIPLFPYRLLLRPWLWLATQRSHVRVFESLAVPAIVARVLAPYGHPLRFDSLTRHHPARPRTLQCGETDFDFIARLCEDEGVYWFFEHQSGGHGLVFVDGGEGAHRPLAGGDGVIPFMVPAPPQPGRRVGSARLGRDPARPPHVDYWSMGREAAGAGFAPDGLRQARFNAHLNHRGIAPGRSMALQGHPQADQNRAYLVVAVDYHLEECPGAEGPRHPAGGKLNDASGHAVDPSSVQRFAMEVQPLSMPFQPDPQAPRPVVRGLQVGVVVAVEAGEVGAACRVKVRWRLAAWARDVQGLVTDWIEARPVRGCGCAGADGRGCRCGAPLEVGEAVLLDFLDGDPDRPVCQGRWGGASFIHLS